MFDVGFSELMVIGIVALVVIGPEKLPRVAKTIGHLMGRAQRYVNDVKADIHREMEIDELRKLQSQMHDAAKEVEQTVASHVSAVESSVNTAVGDVKTDVESAHVASESTHTGLENATPDSIAGPAPASAGDSAPAGGKAVS